MLAAGPSFAPAGGMDRFLRLPYVLPPEDLVEAVRRLRAAWAEVERSGSFVGERNPAPPIIA